MQEDKSVKNKEICAALSRAVQKLMGKKRKSLLAYESDVPRSVIHYILEGKKDPQLTTFWRLAEGLNMKPSELLQQIEENMPDGWEVLEN